MNSRCYPEGPPTEGPPRSSVSCTPAAATAAAPAAPAPAPAAPAAAAPARGLSSSERRLRGVPSGVCEAPQGAPKPILRSQGSEREGPPSGPPSSSRSQAEGFELPLLLLHGGAPRGPPGALSGLEAPPDDEDWQAEVSASVAAAFRDMRGSMFLSSSSSSRSSRLGLGDALLCGGTPRAPRAPRASRGAPRGAPRGPLGSPTLSAASRSTDRTSSATPSERTVNSSQQTPRGPRGLQERVQPPGTPTSEEGAPGGPHEGGPRREDYIEESKAPGLGGPHNAGEKVATGGPSPHAHEGGAPETVADIQTEFLAAYTITPLHVAAGAEAAAADAAPDAAAPEAEDAAAGPQNGGTQAAAAAAAASAAAAAAAAAAAEISSSCCTPHSEHTAKEGPPQDPQGPPTSASRGSLSMAKSPAPSLPLSPKP